MDYKNILLSFEGEIGILALNRPKALNALNIETLRDIQAGIQEVRDHSEMKALIVTGSGEKAFVAGADIAEMKGMNSMEALNFAKLGHMTLKMIQDLDRPVIAAVNGFALGGGTEIALACDFIYASENARFGFPEVTLGIFPGFGGTQRLPRLIGKGKAKAKMAVDTGFNMDLTEALTLESYAFSFGFTTEDQKEGMTAFVEKRKPNFKGK
jgi:enoyl-CoA hydratase